MLSLGLSAASAAPPVPTAFTSPALTDLLGGRITIGDAIEVGSGGGAGGRSGAEFEPIALFFIVASPPVSSLGLLMLEALFGSAEDIPDPFGRVAVPLGVRAGTLISSTWLGSGLAQKSSTTAQGDSTCFLLSL
jgi:hypothetical protein